MFTKAAKSLDQVIRAEVDRYFVSWTDGTLFRHWRLEGRWTQEIENHKLANNSWKERMVGPPMTSLPPRDTSLYVGSA